MRADIEITKSTMLRNVLRQHYTHRTRFRKTMPSQNIRLPAVLRVHNLAKRLKAKLRM